MMKLSKFLYTYQNPNVQRNRYKYMIVDFRDLSDFVDGDGEFLTAKELKEKLSSVYNFIDDIPSEFMDCTVYNITPEINNNQLYLRIVIVWEEI